MFCRKSFKNHSLLLLSLDHQPFFPSALYIHSKRFFFNFLLLKPSAFRIKIVTIQKDAFQNGRFRNHEKRWMNSAKGKRWEKSCKNETVQVISKMKTMEEIAKRKRWRQKRKWWRNENNYRFCSRNTRLKSVWTKLKFSHNEIGLFDIIYSGKRFFCIFLFCLLT